MAAASEPSPSPIPEPSGGETPEDEIEGEELHEFASMTEVVLVLLLVSTITFSYLVKKYKFYYLPESAFTMLMGIVVGWLATLILPASESASLRFQPELFFFVLLPPIVFEAGFSLERKRFFQNFVSIAVYAVVGTVISTFIVGFLVYTLAVRGIAPEIDTASPLQALLFGALISATDPVATLAIMGSPELNCDQLLYSLVFGESVLNDAVAIVLFKSFESLTVGQSTLESTSDYFLIIGRFILISFGSIFIGVLIGLLSTLVFKHVNFRKYPSKEIALLLLCGYLSFAFAEAIGMSGIMSLFFCGISLGHYNWGNLSEETQSASSYILHTFAHTAEAMVFAYIGLCLFTGGFVSWNFGLIALAILICVFARACNIFPLSALVNLGRIRPIPYPMQIIIWFAGLRGAIAFALAVNMPQPVGAEWNNEIIITTTLGIVIFTTVILGGLTEPMLGFFGMKKGSVDDASEADELMISKRRFFIGRQRAPGELSAFQKWWKKFDARYMRPWFTMDGYPGAAGGERDPPLVDQSPQPTTDGGGDVELASASSAGHGHSHGGGHGHSHGSSAKSSGRGPGLASADVLAGGSGVDDGDIGAGSGSFFGRRM